MNKIIFYTAFIFIGFFIGCKKKYPENTLKLGLWRTPAKIELMRGYMTSYKVNGIDSLDELNKYLKQYNLIPHARKIRNCEFVLGNEHVRNYVVMSNYYLEFKYHWNSNYNKIYIEHKNDTNMIKKNIFIVNGANWEILKLVRTTDRTVYHQLKIRASFNGNTYEIQFN